MAKIAHFTRLCIAMMRARGDVVMAAEFAKAWGAENPVERRIKALIAPGATSDSSWAGPLVTLDLIDREFAELLRPATVIGRMAGFRAVPFNIRFPVQTAGASVGWIGEMRPTLAGELRFEDGTLSHSKLGGIVVFTEELARTSDPAAELVIQNDLIAAISQVMDSQLLDPSVAEIPGIAPASITYGAPSFDSISDDMDTIEENLKLLVGSLIAADIQFRAPFFVMRQRTALHLAALRSVAGGGQPLFPHVGVKGGDIWQIPILVSDNLPTDSDSPNASSIVLVDAAEMLLADGGVEVDASRQASLQLRTDPVTGAQQLVSLWESNCVGARVTRMARWKMRRQGAVAVLRNVTY